MGQAGEIPLLPPGRQTLRLEGQETPQLPPGRTVPQLPPMEVLAGETAFFRVQDEIPNSSIAQRYKDARNVMGLSEAEPIIGKGRDVEFDLQARIRERLETEAKTEKELLGLEARAEFEKALGEDYAQVPASLRGTMVKEIDFYKELKKMMPKERGSRDSREDCNRKEKD